MNPAHVWLIVLHRLTVAFTLIPGPDQWALAGMLLLLIALLAVPVGFLTGFLRIEFIRPGRTLASTLLVSLLFPAIAEETLFRVVLLPHPSERTPIGTRLLAGVISLFLFVSSHPLKEWRKRSVRSLTFRDPTFLLIAALLGLACTAAYLASGSLWPSVAIHWAAVFTWLGFLGGHHRLQRQPSLR